MSRRRRRARPAAGAATAVARALAARHAGIVAEAARVFDTELTAPQQMRAAHDIVVARALELRAAYANVLDVSFGFRRVVNRDTGRHEIQRTPCVRFLVARKSTRPPAARAIPRRLLTVAHLEGRSVLCAVPTDVDDRRLYAHVVAHAERVTAEWKGVEAAGALACALTRSAAPGEVFGLSCRHVLSLSARYFDDDVVSATVYLGGRQQGVVVGTPTDVAGRLGAGLSFDARLLAATPASRAALRDSLGGLILAGYAATVHELPADYLILTPRGAIRATFVDAVVGRSAYTIAGHPITHEWLVQSEPEQPMAAGDSGSPVVTADGARLLGMHVAGGDGEDAGGHYAKVAFMIPAWALFTPANYAHTDPTETWTITNP